MILRSEGGGDSQRRSGGLHQELVGGTVVAQYDAEPGHAFVADHANFDAMVGLCNADDGDQTAFDEIDMRDHIAGHFQYLVHIEIDDFKVGRSKSRSAFGSAAKRRLHDSLGEITTLLHILAPGTVTRRNTRASDTNVRSANVRSMSLPAVVRAG